MAITDAEGNPIGNYITPAELAANTDPHSKTGREPVPRSSTGQRNQSIVKAAEDTPYRSDWNRLDLGSILQSPRSLTNAEEQATIQPEVGKLHNRWWHKPDQLMDWTHHIADIHSRVIRHIPDIVINDSEGNEWQRHGVDSEPAMRRSTVSNKYEEKELPSCTLYTICRMVDRISRRPINKQIPNQRNIPS